MLSIAVPARETAGNASFEIQSNEVLYSSKHIFLVIKWLSCVRGFTHDYRCLFILLNVQTVLADSPEQKGTFLFKSNSCLVI